MFLQHLAHIRLASTPLRREVEGTDTDLVSYLFTLSFPGITVSCGLAKHMSVVLLHGGWSGEGGGLGRLLDIGRLKLFCSWLAKHMSVVLLHGGVVGGGWWIGAAA